MSRTARASSSARRLKDGPLPTHYEPWESPIGNPLYPEQTRNPVGAKLLARRTTAITRSATRAFPTSSPPTA